MGRGSIDWSSHPLSMRDMTFKSKARFADAPDIGNDKAGDDFLATNGEPCRAATTVLTVPESDSDDDTDWIGLCA